jgi:hypothetical protein
LPPRPASAELLKSTPGTILKDTFGYDTFRPLQREVIENVLARRDTLAVLLTWRGIGTGGVGRVVCQYEQEHCIAFGVIGLWLGAIFTQIAPAAGISAGAIGLNISGALEMLEHGFHQLGSRPQPGGQAPGLEGAAGADLGE